MEARNTAEKGAVRHVKGEWVVEAPVENPVKGSQKEGIGGVDRE